VAIAWLRERLRGQPPPERRALFQGITYERHIRAGAAPLVLHVVTIDVGAPGIRFVVTPGDPQKKLPFAGLTTSAFLEQQRTQLAVNGDFFTPWHSNGMFDYYPHTGDPVTTEGFSKSGGVLVTRGETPDLANTLRFSRDGRPSFTLPIEEAESAISGRRLITAGHAHLEHWNEAREPRTFVGLDRAAEHLYLFVADGRQRTSGGMTVAEMARALLDRGAHDALMLDGGGSSALVIERRPGRAEVLNSPIHGRVPGRERPVANHLGVFAHRL
jgi:hypothetical protein